MLAQRHSDTSIEAGRSIEPLRVTFRQRVLACIAEHGPVTDQQIARLTGLAENTVRPRRVELARERVIVPVGRARTESGRAALAWEVA